MAHTAAHAGASVVPREAVVQDVAHGHLKFRSLRRRELLLAQWRYARSPRSTCHRCSPEPLPVGSASCRGRPRCAVTRSATRAQTSDHWMTVMNCIVVCGTGAPAHVPHCEGEAGHRHEHGRADLARPRAVDTCPAFPAESLSFPPAAGLAALLVMRSPGAGRSRDATRGAGRAADNRDVDVAAVRGPSSVPGPATCRGPAGRCGSVPLRPRCGQGRQRFAVQTGWWMIGEQRGDLFGSQAKNSSERRPVVAGRPAATPLPQRNDGGAHVQHSSELCHG